MKRLILCASMMLFASISYSQYRGTRQNGVLGTTEDYVTNSPGNSIANSRLIARYKDSTDFALYYSNVRFGMYDASKNDGVPTTILWTDASGNIKKSTIPAWITTELDPIWSSEKNNYYTKTLSDARYLQGFTESDPTVASYIKSISAINISNWNSAFGWGNHALAGYYLASNPNGYISSFTEVDPNVPAYSKSLSSFNVIKTSTDPLYRPISYVPGWTEITGKPTFALVATSGSYNDLSNKPTIPSAQVQSDWNAVSGLGQILNKPTIKRQESYSGTTNSSGIYTVTYAAAYSATPNVQFQIGTGGNNKETILLTSSSSTGFTLYVQVRADVLGLLPTYSNVNSRNVDALVTEK